MQAHYFITGGCGFIGSHIAEELAAQPDAQITLYDNLASGSLENIASFRDRVNFLEGDICDFNHLSRSMQGATRVFHEAANVSVFDSVERPGFSGAVNITGTLNVLRAARENSVQRLVTASSAAIYGNNPQLPKTENMPPDPVSPYAIEKTTNEYYMRVFADLYGLETVALRYFNVYGPRQDPSSVYSGVISIFADCARHDQSPIIYGDGLQTRDFVFVKDVVRANLLAMHSPQTGHGEVFNVGTGRSTSLLDLVETLRRITGNALDIQHKEERPGDIKHSLSSISAISALGYSPQFTIEEGLQRLLDSLT
jgi:UDP-glucose 4-epimerase